MKNDAKLILVVHMFHPITKVTVIYYIYNMFDVIGPPSEFLKTHEIFNGQFLE